MCTHSRANRPECQPSLCHLLTLCLWGILHTLEAHIPQPYSNGDSFPLEFDEAVKGSARRPVQSQGSGVFAIIILSIDDEGALAGTVPGTH